MVFKPPNGWSLIQSRDGIFPSSVEIWAIESNFRQFSTTDLLKIRMEHEEIDMSIEKDEWGKPTLATREWSFNGSHSEGISLLAVSRSKSIGIDVENAAPRFPVSRIIERFFSDSEKRFIGELPTNMRDRTFFRFWASKEAVIKAVPIGSEISVDSVVIELSNDDTLQLSANSKIREYSNKLQLFELDLFRPFVGCLAIEE